MIWPTCDCSNDVLCELEGGGAGEGGGHHCSVTGAQVRHHLS